MAFIAGTRDLPVFSARYPDARKNKRRQHTRHLTEHLLKIALLETCEKHKPMRVSVINRVALAEDMRTLQMIETLGILVIADCTRLALITPVEFHGQSDERSGRLAIVRRD
jgi:hypothetical protein